MSDCLFSPSNYKNLGKDVNVCVYNCVHTSEGEGEIEEVKEGECTATHRKPIDRMTDRAPD